MAYSRERIQDHAMFVLGEPLVEWQVDLLERVLNTDALPIILSMPRTGGRSAIAKVLNEVLMEGSDGQINDR